MTEVVKQLSSGRRQPGAVSNAKSGGLIRLEGFSHAQGSPYETRRDREERLGFKAGLII